MLIEHGLAQTNGLGLCRLKVDPQNQFFVIYLTLPQQLNHTARKTVSSDSIIREWNSCEIFPTISFASVDSIYDNESQNFPTWLARNTWCRLVNCGILYHRQSANLRLRRPLFRLFIFPTSSQHTTFDFLTQTKEHGNRKTLRKHSLFLIISYLFLRRNRRFILGFGKQKWNEMK